MQVVLLRHGIAEDREAFARTGAADYERPLTDKGLRRTRQAVTGLLSMLPDIDVVGTSPYTRAHQTAEVLVRACQGAGAVPERETLDAMQPGGEPREVCQWLAARPRGDTVVLVGHEPDLSGLAAWLTTGRCEAATRFKKAGACLIELTPPPARGGGELLWLLPPAVLRRLARD